MEQEVMPTLDPVEGIDVYEYRDTLLSRFSNPFIKDTLARICLESSAKLPVFLLPTVRDNLAANRDTDISALVIACWAFYSDRHASQDGRALEINDVLADKLHNAASNNQIDSLSFLMLEEVFGKLVDEARFTASFQVFVERLYQQEPVLLISEKVANNKLELARAC
jgi:mannitol 2-dehydrogenase